MAVILKNNATSRLASYISAAATSFAVSAGEGARFPAPTSGQWFPVTVIDSAGNLEVMRCTERGADVLTVARGQEGTTARAFTAGDRIELRITAAAMAEFKQNSEISTFMQGMLDDPDAATARGTLGLGNSAIRDVEVNPLATSSNPIIYGAFGLGNAVTLAGGTNLNSILQPAIYSFTSGSPLVNSPVSGACVVIVSGRAAYPHQEVRPIYGREIYIRSAKVANPTTSAADWNPWDKLYSTDNVSAFAQTILDDADAAAVRSTLELGSAAQWAAQESQADTNTLRLMRVGAFGLGGIFLGPSAAVGLCNPTGFYYGSSEPAGGTFFLDAMYRTNTAGFRLSNTPYQKRWFLHAGAGGNSLALQSPVEIFHSENMPTLTAGNGLTGGGALNVGRTLTLGTPSTISTGSSNSVTATSHTHALSLNTGDILNQTAGAGIGAVGTYAFLRNVSSTGFDAGDTTTGGNLRWASTTTVSSLGPSGTWRCMGAGTVNNATVWLRIS